MVENALYEDRYVTVTPSTFSTVDGTVAISSIVEVKGGRVGRDWRGPAWIIAIGLGIMALASGSASLLGLVIAVAGGYWLYKSKPTHIIFYSLTNGEKKTFRSTDKLRVDSIGTALATALEMRGR